MKKGLVFMLAISCFAALIVTSCGEKFTPLTQDEIAAQADSIFTAQKDAKLEELNAACDANLEAQVEAKVEALKSGETASM